MTKHSQMNFLKSVGNFKRWCLRIEKSRATKFQNKIEKNVANADKESKDIEFKKMQRLIS